MISLFKSLPPSGKPHIADEQITLNEFLNRIKYGHWKTIVEKIRQEPDDKKRSTLKKQLHAVTISGTFKERREDALLQHSGYICIDIDKYTDKSKLLNDQYTYALFKSASGNGIAVIVKIKSDKHKQSFRWLQNYYFTTYGIRIDSAPQNPASLRFASYDDDLYINENSKLSRYDEIKQPKSGSIPVILPKNRFEDLVREVTRRGISIAESYDEYLRLGFALASEFGEYGREYFHALCCISSKYDSHHANKQYDYCLRGKNDGVRIGTFYYMIKQHGVEIPREATAAAQIITTAKRSGADPKPMLIEQGFSPEEAEEATHMVENSEPDIELKSEQQLITAIGIYLRTNHKLIRNSITARIEDDGKDITDEDMNTIFLNCRFFYNSRKITDLIMDKYIHSNHIASVNPIKKFIDENRYRNTNGNIDALVKSINTDTEDAPIYIRKWLLQMCAHIDGKIGRSVLTLIGGQNNGKTEFFRRLLPADLKRYYSESKLDRGKDDEIMLCESLIVMDDEMGGKSKKDAKMFKDLVSKREFTLRAPYQRTNRKYSRLAIMCGTSNDRQLIIDDTGNTRILPVNVITIDFEGYNSIDKAELFMEAYRAYEAGEKYELTREELERLQEISDDYSPIPFERELLIQHFEDGQEFMTSTQIKDHIEVVSNQRILNMTKFGAECRKYFNQRFAKKINGKTVYGYCVLKRSIESAYNQQSIDNEELPY